jgi:polysaccharide biosynthesis transport protein
VFNREITLNYLLQVVRRRKLAIILPAVILSAAAVIFALLLPNIYLSETVILVEPQQSVQTTAGKPSISVSMEKDNLATLSQQILSRSHLEKIITEYDLYSPLPMEQRVRNMRNETQLDVVKPDQTGTVSGFKISYQHKNPRIAAEVTTMLAALFIEENASSRGLIMNERLRFLEDQTAQAKAKLDDQEQLLQILKQKNFEKLPEQREKNLKLLEQLNIQITSNYDALNRAQQQRVYLEAMLTQYQSAPKSVRTIPITTETSLIKAQTQIETQLEEQKRQLAELQNKYTDKHPDVIRASRRLEELNQKQVAELEQDVIGKSKRVAELQQKQAMEVSAAKPQSSEGPESSEALSPETFATLAQVTSQLRSVKPDIQSRTAEQSRLMNQRSIYQSRLEIPPALEQELAGLTRDYNTAKENYQAISNDRTNAQMAQELENKQKAMLFRVIDPAKQPEKPFKPNRRLIVLYGLLAGLGAGFGLAFYREFNDQSLYTEQDVETALGLEVLATIPQI